MIHGLYPLTHCCQRMFLTVLRLALSSCAKPTTRIAVPPFHWSQTHPYSHPPSTHYSLAFSIALFHFLNLLTQRAAVSPARDSASSLLFTFQKLTSEIVFCITLWGFVLRDSSDARHKELCDQKRKKVSCCHFQFCITHLAVIVVSRDVCSVRPCSGVVGKPFSDFYFIFFDSYSHSLAPLNDQVTSV